MEEETNEQLVQIGEAIKKRLDELGYSIKGFCREYKLSHSTFHNIVSRHKPISLRLLIEYLDILGLQIHIFKK